MLERKKKLFSLKSGPGYKPMENDIRKAIFFYHVQNNMQCIFFVLTIHIIIHHFAIAILFVFSF